jgi:hypothetical protein
VSKLVAVTALGVVGVLALVFVAQVASPSDQPRFFNISLRPSMATAGRAVAQYSDEGVRVPAQTSREAGRSSTEASLAGVSAGSSCRDQIRTMDVELEALKASLADQRQGVEQLDVRLAALKAELDVIKAANPGGIPASLPESYAAQAREYNSTLDRRRSAGLQHNATVDEITARLEERNALARGC